MPTSSPRCAGLSAVDFSASWVAGPLVIHLRSLHRTSIKKDIRASNVDFLTHFYTLILPVYALCGRKPPLITPMPVLSPLLLAWTSNADLLSFPQQIAWCTHPLPSCPPGPMLLCHRPMAITATIIPPLRSRLATRRTLS